MIRYLGVEAPFNGFYTSGLDALNRIARARGAEDFASLAAADRTLLAGEIASGKVAEWSGPPAPFWYFVVRSDAIDVVYGTREGFKRLGVPYMAHIEPPASEGWGA